MAQNLYSQEHLTFALHRGSCIHRIATM